MTRPRHAIPVRNDSLLRTRLDELVQSFDITTITPDPLELVLRFRRREDQEVAGLIAAAFAYGRAELVVRNAGWVLDRMGDSPAEFLRRWNRRRDAPRFRGFVHRFQKTPQLVDLLAAIAAVLKDHESLESLFVAGDDGRGDISVPLTKFVAALVDAHPLPVLRRRALSYLLPSPAAGSACKRMNLYLRWMVRRTSPDLGLWTLVDPSRLVMPLDTHVHRISTFLGICDRKAADWTAARSLTDSLQRFDASDPVRYDFAICRLGILDLCSRRRLKENCDQCSLRDVCRFPLS